jgi:hypothetical protein
MLNFSQMLAKLRKYLTEAPRRVRNPQREAENCCSPEAYSRAQRTALRKRAAAVKPSRPVVVATSSAVDVIAAVSVSALFQRLVRLGDTLHRTPEKPNSIVSVSLPWEANDASTSATGS